MSGVVFEIHELHKSLVYLRDYLVKLGPKGRQQDLGLKKVKEAKVLYSKLESILSVLHSQIETEQISTSDITSIHKIINEIHQIFNKIIELSISEQKQSETVKMSDNCEFDLKTAIALLPVMTGQESVTNSLINSIELYSKMISDKSKSQLIEFVLKTRLSPSAQLRLSSTYDTIENLLNDMRKHLIQKKSEVALQWKLHQSKQGNRSIESFGSELENLFVNLTIAQSSGDPNSYKVLKPINERIAIKRFADGLYDRRLSTIIASRQFETLPEAIRTAMDEQSLSSSFEVMNVSRRKAFYRGSNYCHRNSNNTMRARGNYSNNYNRYNTKPLPNTPRGSYSSPRGATYQQGRARGSYSTRSRRSAAPIRHTIVEEMAPVKNELPSTSTNNQNVNIVVLDSGASLCVLSDCVVLSKEIQQGVFVAGLIAKPNNGRIPVRILNTTSNEVEYDFQNITIYDLNYFDEERRSIEHICAKYADVFHLPGDKLSTTNVMTHSISLKDNVSPCYIKPYRIPHSLKQEVQRQIDDMLANDIIEETISEWSSPVLLVPKKTNRSNEKKWRLVIDYRQLNNRIKDDKFPLPNITDILDSLSDIFWHDMNVASYCTRGT
ncbi:hypothetical protein evm_006801 [Chilo suppressalis]|nr:hypothetical protein evm_006801 [Chilo suppressalis]